MTNTDHPHIVQSFEAELKALDEHIRQLASLGREQLASAVAALTAGDVSAANAVVERDLLADDLEEEVEKACIRILALRQPHAADLRLVFAAIRGSAELERVGDYAKNIAKRVAAITGAHSLAAIQSIPRLAKLADATLGMAADAFIGRDAPLAKRAWESDSELDEAYTAFFRETLTYLMEQPQDITAGTHLLFIAKNIERIGDHATNLAEMACYLADGSRLTGTRPKADASADIVGDGK